MISPNKEKYDVIIVGGGVSGLSAAKALRRMGAGDILVIEREEECGGAPRHIMNPFFGLREFGLPMTGPTYARRMRRRIKGVETATGVSITRLLPQGMLEVAGPDGLYTLEARRIVLATGTREASRHARLVSGGRPFGVITYGAFQRYVHFAGLKPFQRPAIVGTEWVSFSAVHTMREIGVDPVCMLEEHPRTTVPELVAEAFELYLMIPIHRGTHLRRILGRGNVEGAEIERDGQVDIIRCDGIVFTGKFIPEAHLIRSAHLEFDSGSRGPMTDQYQRLSDPAYFACGNVLRAVQASWVCSREGERVARFVNMSLSSKLPRADDSVPLRFSDPIRFVWPQRLALPNRHGPRPHLTISFLRPTRGTLRLLVNGREVFSKTVDAMPEQLISIVLKPAALKKANEIELSCETW